MEYSFMGNSLLVYARSLLILVLGVLVVIVLHTVIGRRLRAKSEAEPEHGRWWAGSVVYRRIVVPLLYIGVVWAALLGLAFSDNVDRLLRGLVAALIAVFAVRTVSFLMETSLRKYTQKTGRVEDEKRAKPLISLFTFLLWTVAAIFLLDNLGFNISTLVAGLGVSGIAVAIAAQGILGDLFNYFVIFFDRPFELGDFVIFDDKLGTIEKIGIKTTRIRALSGEQLVVSNSTLVNSRLHNYKRMERRRVVFRIGVTYQTPVEKIKEIPQLIKRIIEERESTQFDRSHFQGYGDFALIFETVYYVLSPDYALYMDIQQEINLRLYTEFENRGIEFAYPSQTLFIQTQGKDEGVHRIGFSRDNGEA
ncbi:MAG TPA: mechanosensitive ion channel [Sediminispirochaeta sp.]|nr:mechanosensitive ion channel [Sediminispirochaeta sp.]